MNVRGFLVEQIELEQKGGTWRISVEKGRRASVVVSVAGLPGSFPRCGRGEASTPALPLLVLLLRPLDRSRSSARVGRRRKRLTESLLRCFHPLETTKKSKDEGEDDPSRHLYYAQHAILLAIRGSGGSARTQAG